MKIAFVLDDTFDSTDGVQQYIKLLGNWFTKKGHNIEFIVGASKSQPNVHSMSKNIRVSFNGNKLTVPLPAKKSEVKKLLESKQYDVLHVQMPHSPFLANKCIALAPQRTAIVGTFHVAPYGRLATIGSRIIGKTVKSELDRIHTIIAVSDVAADFAKKTFGESSVVIPNAVDLKEWHPLQSSKRSVDIVFIGRLVKRKGCEYLLHAVHDIISADNKRKLVVKIAGNGPLKDELMHYVKAHKLDSYVSFLGYVTEKQKKDLLHSTKLAVFPSTGGESFGIVLIEAMAAGALAMGGNNPGYSTVLGSSDALVNPRHSSLLARQIEEYLDQPSVYSKERDRQQSRVKRYDINHVGNAILGVYKQAIKDNERQ